MRYQGPAFPSKEFDEKMTEWRIHHIPATTATLAIAAYLNTTHTDWDVKPQGAALAVNTARQSTTEMDPFGMFYADVQ